MTLNNIPWCPGFGCTVTRSLLLLYILFPVDQTRNLVSRWHLLLYTGWIQFLVEKAEKRRYRRSKIRLNWWINKYIQRICYRVVYGVYIVKYEIFDGTSANTVPKEWIKRYYFCYRMLVWLNNVHEPMRNRWQILYTYFYFYFIALPLSIRYIMLVGRENYLWRGETPKRRHKRPSAQIYKIYYIYIYIYIHTMNTTSLGSRVKLQESTYILDPCKNMPGGKSS